MSTTHNHIMSWQLLAQPRPVGRPTVGEGFTKLPAWKRSLASIGYGVRCLERWISPNGWVREWLRLNVLAAVLLGTFVLLLGPVISLLLRSPHRLDESFRAHFHQDLVHGSHHPAVSAHCRRGHLPLEDRASQEDPGTSSSTTPTLL